MEVMRCISCNREVSTDFIKFKCPVCGRDIIRCLDCREAAIRYRCECGFEGP